MKRQLLFLITVSTIVMSSGTALAQSQPSMPEQPSLPANTGMTLQSGASEAIPWISPDDNRQGTTRAQVEQELIQAQQDGQFANLNKTVYAHH
ncbi:DUF4148 domain-containing protein [Paraburkholderia sediminicola]|uniref:DUF4148 domain-containing protein n=1 Tax=Paraburkholderia rhynchosiae TaxID=487049 RepID=A0ACC7N7N3_9BURK